jgi:hypothetical protein
MDSVTTGPRLRELRWLEPNTCHAVFEEEDGTTVETVFRIEHVDTQSGEQITIVNDDARVVGRIGGTAAQVRTVNHAAFVFCCAAQGQSAESP